jgi:hypothetical protein
MHTVQLLDAAGVVEAEHRIDTIRDGRGAIALKHQL